MLSFLLYYVSGNSERMIFNKNIIPNNDQAPFLIPGHEEKCSVVLGCCGFASRMQHAYPKSPILRASIVLKEIIFGTRIYVQILVLQGFVELSDVVKSGGIYSVRNAFATRLQQKYLKNIGHFSVVGTGECPFLLCRFCIGNYDVLIF